MNMLNAFSRSNKARGDFFRIGINFLIGIGLCSVASMVKTEDGFKFAQSALILPSVALAFVLGERKIFLEDKHDLLITFLQFLPWDIRNFCAE
jgi:hypothetical protein